MKPAPSLLPYAAIIAAIAIYGVMDTTMKYASLAIGAYSATFWRSAIGVVIVLPIWLREGPRWPERAVLILHAKRGCVTAGVALTFFYGLVRLPLAEAIAISFIAPLIALFLAAVLLGEKIGRQAIGASLLGLVGVGIIAIGRTGEAGANPEATRGVVAVLISACLYAWSLTLQRRQAQLAKPAEVALFQSAIAALLLSLGGPWLLVMPGSIAWQSAGASAALSVIALMLASWAYGRAETQALVPFEYTAFLWASLLGWLVFKEHLTLPTMLGAVLIITGCWIAAPRKHTEQIAL